MNHALNKTIFTFFGSPGCGKGTQAEQLKKDFDLQVLSTGNVARQHMAQKTPLGIEFAKYVDKGQLIPDQLISSMVEAWLDTACAKNVPVILDGYPRTNGQAGCLVSFVRESKPEHILRVISFEIPAEEISARLSNRIVCENKGCQAVYSLLSKKPQQEGVCDKCGGALVRRDDDAPEVVQERLVTFERYKQDLLDGYEKIGQKVETIDISGKSIAVVYTELKVLLGF